MAAPAAPRARKGPVAPRRRAKKPPPPSVWRAVLIAAGAVFVLDQVLKYLVVHTLRLDRVREIDVLDPWLNLRMAWNQGMNFGLFASDVEVMRWVLIAIALAVCLWVAIWIGRARPSRFAQVAAGLLIGGALGNVVDRLLYGAVADFLNMSLPGWRNPYSFNLADIAIFLGAVGLVLQPPESKPQPRRRRNPAQPRVSPRPAPRAKASAEATPPATDATAAPEQGRLALDDKTRDGDGKTR
ncbi:MULTISPECIES: signal peptidase II [unclassified Paracoccus (in: a-proteobacteria)]|uniref:signal peptidase II n=1 Tax=unclassified Paracoccus (in: a-proteobacteria) TaxID=2688777 RepID=UPI0021E1900F|nr:MULTISPECIES: signal peptidase II [unclassified Paracoccus (in: a-proteobacteria)]UXU75828.1 signal peptidase II [Paracoccus sp. SMMA_5]UXU81737.1 signal peptidase II [Paracoccus sp. SMMA_5_TC]